MKKKKVLITGITGQDGSYLAERLLNDNNEVHGMVRRSSNFNSARIDHLLSNKKLKLFFGDLLDISSLEKKILEIKPDCIFNLAAQSHVKVSFEIPEYTGNVDALGTLRLLEAAKRVSKSIKFYQASTSEIFGNNKDRIPQSENTIIYPKSPYGVAKVYSYWISRNYRESFNMFISNGILFNHESERRGKTFVTRKLSIAVAAILRGENYTIDFGNLNSYRDWGYAPEYVDSMIKILDHNKPEDFVIATGKTTRVKDLIEYSFESQGIKTSWIKDKKGNLYLINKKNNKKIIRSNLKYYRPSEVDYLCGDPKKANKILKWSHKSEIFEIMNKMIKHDYDNPQCKF